jgi:rubrerythrin
LHSWLAERIEVLARDIYGELAYHPGTPPGVRQVLLRLADEEEHHAQRIRLLKATQRNSAWAEKALTASADPEVARLFQALARQDVWHRQLLERIRREAPQPATQGA